MFDVSDSKAELKLIKISNKKAISMIHNIVRYHAYDSSMSVNAKFNGVVKQDDKRTMEIKTSHPILKESLG